MKDYTLKTETIGTPKQKNKYKELPSVPFIISVIRGNYKYLVSQFTETGKCNYYVVTSLSETGKTYNQDYTKERLLRLLNEDKWKLVKAKIIFEEE